MTNSKQHPSRVGTPHVSARVQLAIETFITHLRRRQIHGSHNVAEKMLDIIRMVVSSGKWGTVNVLIDLIKLIGKRCQDAQPLELCTGNVVRRLLNVIREECHQLRIQQKAAAAAATASSASTAAAGDATVDAQLATATAALSLSSPTSVAALSSPVITSPSAANAAGTASSVDPPVSPHGSHLHHHHVAKPSVFSLFPDTDMDVELDYSQFKSTATKSLFVEAVNEMLDELRSIHESIATQSVAHIHSNEIILTCGDSHTAESFFKYANSKKRTFHVIVTETAPDLSGHKFAAKLAALGIETTVIPDSAVFAVMSRVNKVVLGSHAILANGGLVAVAGSAQLAAAAKHYSVPVVVVAGLYKLTPTHPFDLDALTRMSAPSSVVEYADDALAGACEVWAPMCDLVEPELVSLFITNEGAFAPSYMYRLLTESYHPEDTVLEPRKGAFDKFFAGTGSAGVQGGKKAAAATARKAMESPVPEAGEDEDQ
ncbi:hypothetical protein BCR44DRAFT_31099 [Catenaria anguillulae PL171]|uniref:Translation initiation factor eIF2B subunit beta n=1 Tax=Catenaria anguillulae PL171 TaxID=765915 RepID=A0A1Y2I4N2_9FUNG|nr:hypothetical protein BCR44DRAFT_31099 [Catenaria anguillulae PL171]